jgi:hypothetical protein
MYSVEAEFDNVLGASGLSQADNVNSEFDKNLRVGSSEWVDLGSGVEMRDSGNVRLFRIAFRFVLDPIATDACYKLTSRLAAIGNILRSITETSIGGQFARSQSQTKSDGPFPQIICLAKGVIQRW